MRDERDDREDARLPARREELRALRPQVSAAPVTTLEYEPAAPGIREYASVFQRRRLAIMACLGAVFAISVVVTLVTPRTYEATATLLISEPPSNAGQPTDNPVPATMAAMGSPNLDTHVQLLQGQSMAEEAAKYLRENGGPVVKASELRKSLTTRAVRDTQLIRISARAHTTEEAEKIANATARAYVSMNRKRARGSSESTGRYLSEQLVIAKRSLTQAEDGLKKFRESTGTIAADASASDLMGRATSLRSQADTTAADLAQAMERARRIRAELARQNSTIESGQVRDNTVIQQLRGKLAELEGQRLAAEARYTSEYPGPLNQIKEQIRVVQGQLDQEVKRVVRGGSGDLDLQQSLTAQLVQAEAEASALRARHGQLQAELGSAKQELGKVPQRQITLTGLQRKVDVAQNIYSDLLRKSQEIEVGRVMALGNADIVEPATQPRLPVRPNVPLNLVLGVLLGLGLGVGVALVQDQFDDTLRDQMEATRLMEAPVLGTIPMIEGAKKGAALPVLASQSLATEAYRALRYCLDFITQGNRGRVVLVTSPGPGEGKSTTVLNLARAVAMTGRRVLVVDTDLRRAGLGRMLKMHEGKGVTDVLLGESSAEEAFQKCPDSGVLFLSAGKEVPHPTELLDSQAMRDLIDDLREKADVVILDSPPVLAVADGLVLANLSDAVLMVCVAGQSQRYDLQLARALLARVGETVSGVVVNKLGERAGYGYQDRHHYYQ